MPDTLAEEMFDRSRMLSWRGRVSISFIPGFIDDPRQLTRKSKTNTGKILQSISRTSFFDICAVSASV